MIYRNAILSILLAALLAGGCGDGEDDINRDIPAAEARELRALSRDYLAQHLVSPSHGGATFCACELLGRRDDGDTITLYLWAFCQEYYARNGEPETGSGVSLPVALLLRADSGRYTVLRHATPRDGAGFAPSVREIFPEELWGVVLSEDVRNHNAMVKRLEQEALQEAAKQLNTGKPPKKVLL